MTRNFLVPITACIGQPVAENPTQVMVEAAYSSLGIDWRYVTLEVGPSDLADAVRGIRAMGFVGFNCTIPHKVTVIEHLDELGESAAVMQAVNCVVRRGDRLVGENTDGKGFVQAVRRRLDPVGSEVTMIGAGGAARAIAVELSVAGIARLRIVNRDTERGAGLAALVGAAFPAVAVEATALGDHYRIPASTDVLINATSVGLFPNIDAELPLDLRDLRPGCLVADVVFNPADTHLLRHARTIGFDTVDGVEMLVGQGVIGVEYWTGRTPDRSVMRSALTSVL
jgi:shikimate dehydrogenase